MLTIEFGATFCQKLFPLFKNGQKKCPKTKTQNTFQQNLLISSFCRFIPTFQKKWLYIYFLMINDKVL